MTSYRPGTRRRLVSLLVALAVAVPLAAAPTPAAGADHPAEVTLSEAEVTGTALSLSGTVTNTGPSPLAQVTVDLWRSRELLRSGPAVTGALVAANTTPGTAAVVEAPNRVVLVTGVEELAPGESRPFTVSGTLAALGLTQADATWWVGVDVSGRTAGARGSRALANARTLATRPATPLPIAWIVEFSTTPRQLKQHLFTDEGLAVEVATGRLASLMDVAETGRTSWVLDPSLRLELEDMADGYRVQSTDGSTPGAGQAVAQAWLDRLGALPGSRGATALFGTPDLSATAGLRDTSVLQAAVRATASAAATDSAVGVTILDRADADGLRAAQGTGRPVVALDTGAPAVRVRTADGDALVAATSPAAFTASPLLPDTPLNRRAARFALARASGGEVHWLRTAVDPGPDSLPYGFERAWLADVLSLEPRPWQPPASPGGASSVDAATLARLRDLSRRMTAYADAAPEAGVGAFADAALARGASTWWSGAVDAQAAWIAGLERRLGLAGDMVSLDATPRFSMTGDTSEFPVTVTNHLPDAVLVRVVASSDNPQRIRLEAPVTTAIQPGASSTVLLRAVASGGGVVQAGVRVETVGGHRLTPDRTIAVETTNFGTIGWVLVIASGIVLVVTTALRIRQVRAKGKAADG